MKGYKETGWTSTKPIPGKKGNVRTKRLVGISRKKVSRNPRRSMRKMAKDLQAWRRTICIIIKDGLCLKPYKMRRWHLSLVASKNKRLSRTKNLLQEMRSANEKVFIWSNENIFTVEPPVNVQNDRIPTASSARIISGSSTPSLPPKTSRGYGVTCSGISLLEVFLGLRQGGCQGQQTGSLENSRITCAALGSLRHSKKITYPVRTVHHPTRQKWHNIGARFTWSSGIRICGHRPV